MQGGVEGADGLELEDGWPEREEEEGVEAEEGLEHAG